MNHNDPVWDTQWAIPAHELLDQYLILNSGFDVTERVGAAYLQLPFSGEGGVPYRGNIGLRWVHTQQTGLGYAEILDGSELRITRRTYDDWLPSFNVALDLSDDVVLRFAGNKALTRPDPIDMTSYLNLGDFEDGEDEIGSGSGGNPDLESYRTTSFDASLEWYPERGGSYALGIFYKDLDGWIARGRNDEIFTVPIVDGDGNVIEIRDELYSIRRKVNTDGGTIQGAELAFHLPFDSFTDGFMSYFGINGSVTYVDAEIDAVVPENNLPISLRGTSE